MSALYSIPCADSGGGQVVLTVTGQAHILGVSSGALSPSYQNADSIIWTIAHFDTINDDSAFNILLKIDTTAIVGSPICITVAIIPVIDDFNPGNNTATCCFPVRNSNDPNEKEVYPLGAVDSGQWLTYTIHFQNTGTAPAQIYI